ncbi:MAG TPA: hypothetical protein VLY24_14685 [Bryobacteraceae bacterium]|nr:hypothetical protein [Bryobacteraceae bacterium]
MIRVDFYTKVVLTAIAILLGIVAIRPIAHPVVVPAQSDAAHLYIEPGVATLRNPNGLEQLQGKMMIDLRNGNAWGFPTLLAAPYPVDTTTSKPPASEPMYLGRFDFAKIKP